MSTTNPVGSSGSAGSNSTSSTSNNLQISSSDFLQLITTQMQQQNPLQPSDPTQFLSQLEQMSQVASLQSLQTSMASLSTSLQSSQMTNGASLLGHSVLAPAKTVTLDGSGTPVTGAVSAPTGTTSLTVQITTPGGSLVNTFQIPPASSGLTNFSWNGQTSTGAAAPAGTYNISVTAMNKDSQTAQVTPLVTSKVQSVTLDPSSQSLNLNTSNGTVAMSSVVSIL